MQALLSSTYFGPVQWYQKLCRHERVFVERYDSYRKQTYRNRCVIAAANGPQTLTVPVERQAGGQRLLTRDVRISDHGNWRHQHWHALMSAYSESPLLRLLRRRPAPVLRAAVGVPLRLQRGHTRHAVRTARHTPRRAVHHALRGGRRANGSGRSHGHRPARGHRPQAP